MPLSLSDLEAYMAAKSARIHADNLVAKGRMIAFAALGIGAGVGGAAYGFSFLREPGRISKVEIANPMVTLDPQSALKVTPTEPMRVETPPSIKLDPASAIRVDQSAPFKVEQTAPFRVEGSRPELAPRPEQVKVPEGTPTRVVTDFTIFHRYEVNETERVVTGWNFSDNQATTPNFQYCYFVRNSSTVDLEDESVKFALDGEIVRPSSRLLNAEQTRAMFKHCVWHANTKTSRSPDPTESRMVPVGRPTPR